MKNQYLKEKLDQVKSSISGKTLRAVDLIVNSVCDMERLTV